MTVFARMPNQLRDLGNSALELLFPSRCEVCGHAAAPKVQICPHCDKELPRISGTQCEVCSQPFASTHTHLICSNCIERDFQFVCCLSPMRACGPVRDIIHRLKYSKSPHLADVIASWMVPLIEDPRLKNITIDALVPVPLHKKRLRERGYNQAALLADQLSRIWKIPIFYALTRTHYTETQTHFDRSRRMENLRNAFDFVHNTTLIQKNIMLIDDVFTTGSTLNECARTLLRHGVGSVRAMTAARA
ncbi:MAG: ComF family protein [Chthoniobacterales bacterium]